MFSEFCVTELMGVRGIIESPGILIIVSPCPSIGCLYSHFKLQHDNIFTDSEALDGKESSLRINLIYLFSTL